MIEQKFPKGWDEERVKGLLEELDSRTEAEWLAADEASASDDEKQTMVAVPNELLPEVMRLLATRKPE